MKKCNRKGSLPAERESNCDNCELRPKNLRSTPPLTPELADVIYPSEDQPIHKKCV